MKILRVLGLGLLLAGCDEPNVITHVDKLSHMSLADLWTMQDSRGIPVEIHGLPTNRVTDQALAEAIRPPAGAAQDVSFYSTPVGSWDGGHGWRLVLHFNPQGGPNSYQDCKRMDEARTNTPPKEGFAVNASFCKGSEWQAHGFLKALKSDPADLEAFRDALQSLLVVIFREEKDR